MVLAIALVLLVVGSVLFHYLSPWYFTPIASNWGGIDATVNLTFWVTGFVFVVVNLFMAWCVWRYRHRKGDCRALRTREQEAGGRADSGDYGGRRRDAGPRPARVGEIHRRPERRDGVRGRRPPMELQLSLPGRGRRAWHRRCALRQRRESVRHQSRRPERARRHPDRKPGSASAHGQVGQGGAALDRRPARLHGTTSSGPR